MFDDGDDDHYDDDDLLVWNNSSTKDVIRSPHNRKPPTQRKHDLNYTESDFGL